MLIGRFRLEAIRRNANLRIPLWSSHLIRLLREFALVRRSPPTALPLRALETTLVCRLSRVNRRRLALGICGYDVQPLAGPDSTVIRWRCCDNHVQRELGGSPYQPGWFNLVFRALPLRPKASSPTPGQLGSGLSLFLSKLPRSKTTLRDRFREHR